MHALYNPQLVSLFVAHLPFPIMQIPFPTLRWNRHVVEGLHVLKEAAVTTPVPVLTVCCVFKSVSQ